MANGGAGAAPAPTAGSSGAAAAGSTAGGSAGATPSSGGAPPTCDPAPLDEHVTFEDPDDGRDGLRPFKAEVGGGNYLGTSRDEEGPEAPEGLRHGQIEWFADNYTGTRTTRGVESRGERVIGELWYSYLMWVPNEYPDDQKQIVAQLIAWHPGCETDKTIVLSLNDNRLSAHSWFGDQPNQDDFYLNTVENDSHVLSEDLPRETWLRVVLHARPSNAGTGEFEGWLLALDGTELASFSEQDISLGTGCFEPSGDMKYGVYPKFGLYAHDTNDYVAGERRVIYFDDARVVWGDPNCAFEAVTR